MPGMSRESLIILLGLVVFFAPALGIPDDWRDYLLTGTGLALVLLGYLLRRSAYLRKTDLGNGERGTDSFVESQPQ
jgi:hypothetical protein